MRETMPDEAAAWSLWGAGTTPKKKPKVTTKGKAPARPAFIPFTSTNRILLVGEGNFSFTAALALNPPPILQYLPAGNITATAYDSEEECYSKYPDAQNIVQQLREKGVEVVFGVDATKLEKCAPLKGRKYDKIMWNFPHAGKRFSSILTLGISAE